ncbi:hypothetical protein A9Q73_03650 [Bermanella sp. 47_1433_sub80_T6]|nr:hypothetical protein A9Q73_03650 [Bermanella sp. 47_1433_sub80_T6]
MAGTKQRRTQRTPEGYLRLPQVLELIPIGKSTWWKGCAAGMFPKPIKLSPRITVWIAKEILDFIETSSGR